MNTYYIFWGRGYHFGMVEEWLILFNAIFFTLPFFFFLVKNCVGYNIQFFLYSLNIIIVVNVNIFKYSHLAYFLNWEAVSKQGKEEEFPLIMEWSHDQPSHMNHMWVKMSWSLVGLFVHNFGHVISSYIAGKNPHECPQKYWKPIVTLHLYPQNRTAVCLSERA